MKKVVGIMPDNVEVKKVESVFSDSNYFGQEV